MDSSSSRLNDEQARQAEIRQQIAFLQAQLKDMPGECAQRSGLSTPKRKHQDSSVLAPPTPSPKKRKLKHKTERPRPHVPPLKVLQNSNTGPPRPNHAKFVPIPGLLEKPAPSNLLSKLAALSKRPESSPVIPVRSTAFRETPKLPSIPKQADTARADVGGQNSVAEDISAPRRDERLALIEELEIGPCEYKAPFDDPDFDRLEPNSGIRLCSRTLSNDDMREYLRGRYYLPPSRLYSVVRLLPDKQGYDIPVAGDWVTIAVVAERGPVKFTRPPVGIGNERDDDQLRQGGSNSTPRKQPQDSKAAGKKKPENVPAPMMGKKYVNVKLIDFGARSRSSSSATGGKEIIRGDAFLTLLLFESDGADSITREDGKVEKVYKGGSRGAFESMSKLKEGDVVALLNPKILKPFQRNNDQPHPTSNILALTPESAASIAVIGRAQDLGMCTVIKRDGKVCGGWCDKRVSDVCEWHLQHAVEQRRAGRAEFSTGSSGMSTTSGPKHKPTYDPARQWGLKPAESHEPGSATYMISGHTISGSGSDMQSRYVSETMGREGQAKAKRKLVGKDADRALKALLERDKDGMKAVLTAREFATVDDRKQTKSSAKGKSSKPKKSVSKTDRDQDATAEDPQRSSSKHSYPAVVIKNLGFDPAVQAGRRRSNDVVVQRKLETLSEVSSAKKDFHLGPRPGRRIRSGVVPPRDDHQSDVACPSPGVAEPTAMKDVTQGMVDLDDL